MEEMHGQLPLLAFLTGADSSTVVDNIGIELGVRHAVKQVECQLPLRALLTGADDGAVADDVRG